MQRQAGSRAWPRGLQSVHPRDSARQRRFSLRYRKWPPERQVTEKSLLFGSGIYSLKFLKQHAHVPGHLDSSPAITLAHVPGEHRKRGHVTTRTGRGAGHSCSGGHSRRGGRASSHEGGTAVTEEASRVCVMFQQELNVAVLIMHSFYIYTLALFCFNQKTDC